MKTVDAATDQWLTILPSLGIDSKFLVNKHGPCPTCGGDDRFRFDNKEGRGTWICSYCGAGNGIDLLMNCLDITFAEAAKHIDSITGRKQDKSYQPPRKDGQLNAIAKRLCKVGDDPVRKYLRSRGLSPSSGVRYDPAAEYWQDGKLTTHPAMVVPFTDSKNCIVAYHTTYLTPNGTKASVEVVRKNLPQKAILKGAALRLTDVCEHIGIAEGIETALAVMQLDKIPCWAASSTSQMATFVPPKGIRSITIYADRDASFAGEAAAYKLANKLSSKYMVTVKKPDTVGFDYADVWSAQKNA